MTNEKTISIGKYRGMQQCATERGVFAILALDHRNNLKKALNPEAPENVTSQELIKFKQEVSKPVAKPASAILLDPEVGAFQCLSGGAVPRSSGLIISIEATGYLGDSGARQSRLLSGWSIAKAKRMGADAIKLLVYYHPAAKTAALIEALVEQVTSECIKHDICFFLEPLTYSVDPDQPQLRGNEFYDVLFETVKTLSRIGPDVIKIEFPVDIQTTQNETAWADACAELSAVCPIPWVLLSGSANFNVYLRQVVAACSNGCSGVAAGRAIWREAASLSGKSRADFLAITASDRMYRIASLCDSIARPWTDCYSLPEPDQDFFKDYPEE